MKYMAAYKKLGGEHKFTEAEVLTAREIKGRPRKYVHRQDPQAKETVKDIRRIIRTIRGPDSTIQWRSDLVKFLVRILDHKMHQLDEIEARHRIALNDLVDEFEESNNGSVVRIIEGSGGETVTYQRAAAANFAVLKLHSKTTVKNIPVCAHCAGIAEVKTSATYPCATRRAIEGAMR